MVLICGVRYVVLILTERFPDLYALIPRLHHVALALALARLSHTKGHLNLGALASTSTSLSFTLPLNLRAGTSAVETIGNVASQHLQIRE